MNLFIRKNKHLKDRLTKIHVEPESVPSILNEVENKGFNQQSMFPDIDGVALRVKEKVLGNLSTKEGSAAT